MYYAALKKYDVANGPGVRVSLFVSGCTHHCPGCFNEVAWDFHYGTPFTEDTIDEVITALAPDYISGLSLLGGEPMEHANQQGLLPLLKKVREVYPEKSIWCYSGYDFEKDILGRMVSSYAETKELISYLDVLVDGRFEEDLKDLNLWYRGSANQRVILVPESLRAGKVVHWQPPTEIPDANKQLAEAK
ncbi:MAG: anaerobic ribonucleoside-triphosphate reductase activating protein [Lachnospiraceae bacterium]|nr:anaerobic ribonucleoside-triphosphate reductase activating protein [Lachnospiraceae bacterium]